MSLSANLALPFIEAAQAQKHVTHNEALRLLDTLVQLAVLDRDLSAPPLSPSEGQRWIIGPSPTGAWSGRAGHVAAWQDAGWDFSVPRIGWTAFVVDESVLVTWDGSAWVNALGVLGGSGSGSFQNVGLLGVGTNADATNPFSAKLNNALWTAKAVAEGGSGDLRYKLSKESAAKTLSLLLQTNFSGRAEIGLTGDDDFHFKVSADGATWTEALLLKASTGEVTFGAPAATRANLGAQGTSEKGAANGYAALDATGKVPTSQLPALAQVDTFVVSSQAAMLALTAQRGDLAVRTDLNKTFSLAADDSTVLANWIEHRTPTNLVLSVNGQTGAVSLAKADVGLGNVDNTSDAGKPVSSAQAAAIAPKLDKAGGVLTGPLAWAARVDVATAASPDIAAAASNYLRLTGSTTITSFPAPAAGSGAVWRDILLGADVTITNGVNLIVPGNADLAGKAGDVVRVVWEGGTVWRVLWVQRASGLSLVLDEATAAETWAATVANRFVSPRRLADAMAEQAIAYAATVTLDFNAGRNFAVATLTGNITLANPTNLRGGDQTGRIRLLQDGTGGRTIAYGTAWKFPGGSSQAALSTAANAADYLYYDVRSATEILAQLNKAFA